jgi:hypothetical protein
MAARGMAAGDKSIVNMDIMANITSMDIKSIGNHVIVSTSTTDTTDIRNPSNMAAMEVKNNNTAHNINNLKNNSNTEHKSSTVNNKSQRFSKRFTNQI